MTISATKYTHQYFLNNSQRKNTNCNYKISFKAKEFHKPKTNFIQKAIALCSVLALTISGYNMMQLHKGDNEQKDTITNTQKAINDKIVLLGNFLNKKTPYILEFKGEKVNATIEQNNLTPASDSTLQEYIRITFKPVNTDYKATILIYNKTAYYNTNESNIPANLWEFYLNGLIEDILLINPKDPKVSFKQLI